MRRLVAEVVRLRDLLAELDAYCGVVQRVWSEDARSKLSRWKKCASCSRTSAGGRGVC